MARMINAEELAKAFAEFLAKSYFGLLRTPTWDDAMNVFDKATKVDAVEVVRCKDCKYVGTDANMYFVCNRKGMGLRPFNVYHDDYCSYGDPKEKDNGNDKNTD